MIKYSIKIIKKSYFQLIAFCLFFLLSACSKTPEGTGYFPLQKGLSYTYKVTTEYTDGKESRLIGDYPGEKFESRITIDNLGKKNVDGKSYYVRRTSSGIDYYLNNDNDGIYREALRTMLDFKPIPDMEKRFVLKRPFEVGTEWSIPSKPTMLMRLRPEKQRAGTEAPVPMLYKIEELNTTVTVPAGTFENCIKIYGQGSLRVYGKKTTINGESNLPMSVVPMSVVEWYAEGVGLVKQVRYESAGDLIDAYSGLKVHSKRLFLGGKTTLVLEKFDN
jgi:hypothetical protein